MRIKWMLYLRHWVVVVLAVTSCHAMAFDDLLTSQLVDEARVWQRKGRDDLAGNTWRRLLATDPQHGEALVSLGLIEVRADHLPEARDLYARASHLKPAPPRLAQLSEALGPEPSPARPVIAAPIPVVAPAVAVTQKAVVRQKKRARVVSTPQSQSKPGVTQSQKTAVAPSIATDAGDVKVTPIPAPVVQAIKPPSGKPRPAIPFPLLPEN